MKTGQQRGFIHNGRAELKYKDNSRNLKYIGHWLNGVKNGNGILLLKSGDIYDGEWKRVAHGKIKHVKPDGTGDFSEYADGHIVKQIRDLTTDEVAEIRQKAKDHEKEFDDVREYLKRKSQRPISIGFSIKTQSRTIKKHGVI